MKAYLEENVNDEGLKLIMTDDEARDLKNQLEGLPYPHYTLQFIKRLRDHLGYYQNGRAEKERKAELQKQEEKRQKELEIMREKARLRNYQNRAKRVAANHRRKKILSLQKKKSDKK